MLLLLVEHRVPKPTVLLREADECNALCSLSEEAKCNDRSLLWILFGISLPSIEDLHHLLVARRNLTSFGVAVAISNHRRQKVERSFCLACRSSAAFPLSLFGLMCALLHHQSSVFLGFSLNPVEPIGYLCLNMFAS